METDVNVTVGTPKSLVTSDHCTTESLLIDRVILKGKEFEISDQAEVEQLDSGVVDLESENEDSRKSMESQEVVYIVEDSEASAINPDHDESLDENEEQETDTMVYMVDGDKVVLISKHWLEGDPEANDEIDGGHPTPHHDEDATNTVSIDEDICELELDEEERHLVVGINDDIQITNVVPSANNTDQNIQKFLDESEDTELGSLKSQGPKRSLVTRKGIKRKRDVLLKRSEERPITSAISRKGQQVVRKRDVQLFSRDQLVALPYLPEYYAEEVVAAETQDKITGGGNLSANSSGAIMGGGRRKRKLRGQNYRGPMSSYARGSLPLVNIRPKPDDGMVTIQPHFLEALSGQKEFGSPIVMNLSGVANNKTNINSPSKSRVIFASNNTASPTKLIPPSQSTGKQLLPKLAMKPSVFSLPGSNGAPSILADSGVTGIKILKNVDVVVKDEDLTLSPSPGGGGGLTLTAALPPPTSASPGGGGLTLTTALPTTLSSTLPHPMVKATKDSIKFAIPKFNKTKKTASNSSVNVNIIPNKIAASKEALKSILIQQKLDSMHRISPSVMHGTSFAEMKMNINSHWETISKDLEKCNYPKLKRHAVEEHRWLWQFMKELFDRGDRCMEWKNVTHGVFALKDIERLGQLWENYKILTKQAGKAQCWRQLRYYFGLQDDNRIIKPLHLADGKVLFQFQPLFYRERFTQYSYKPVEDFQALEKDIPNISSIIKPLNPTVPALFCSRGCGSQFRKSDALERHEKVCTFSQD